MKDKVKHLVKSTRLVDHMPHGSIKAIAEKLKKERGTVRGALTGKWVNIDVIDASLDSIESEIVRLTNFLEEFKKQYNQIK